MSAGITQRLVLLGSARAPGGVFYGLNGQTLTGDVNGAWAVTANGTNQNITLTPSGTGTVQGLPGDTRMGLSKIYTASAGDAFGIEQVSSAQSGYGAAALRLFASGLGTNGIIAFGKYTSATAFTEYAQFKSNSNFLLGTTTDSSNGRLQLVTHTTSAGGIGFGTDTNLYRSAADQLMTDDSLTILGVLSKSGVNGQLVSIKQLTELTTIAAAATTATTIQIPANAIVFGVSVRVTTVVPDAATFTVTGTTSATAFQTGASVSTAATTTDAGTKSCPYLNTAAQTITFTFNTAPLTNTGRIRITIHYVEITPATS